MKRFAVGLEAEHSCLVLSIFACIWACVLVCQYPNQDLSSVSCRAGDSAFRPYLAPSSTALATLPLTPRLFPTSSAISHT